MTPRKSGERKLAYNRERYRLNREAILKQQRQYRLNKKLNKNGEFYTPTPPMPQSILKRFWNFLKSKGIINENHNTTR